MGTTLNLPFGIYVSTSDPVDMKYAVASDAARDASVSIEVV